jgi:hypothetical protein
MFSPCTSPSCAQYREYGPNDLGNILAAGCILCVHFNRFDLYTKRIDPEPCDVCKGTGLESNEKRCPACGGTGEKPGKE